MKKKQQIISWTDIIVHTILLPYGRHWKFCCMRGRPAVCKFSSVLAFKAESLKKTLDLFMP
jgi:hypothetical protein